MSEAKKPAGRPSSTPRLFSTGIYQVKRYLIEFFEVEIQAGEHLTRPQVLDRAEDPHSNRILRETLTRTKCQDTERRNPA